MNECGACGGLDVHKDMIAGGGSATETVCREKEVEPVEQRRRSLPGIVLARTCSRDEVGTICQRCPC